MDFLAGVLTCVSAYAAMDRGVIQQMRATQKLALSASSTITVVPRLLPSMYENHAHDSRFNINPFVFDPYYLVSFALKRMEKRSSNYCQIHSTNLCQVQCNSAQTFFIVDVIRGKLSKHARDLGATTVLRFIRLQQSLGMRL